jgi:hypothetical protein
MVEKISMNVDETLELEYLVEQISGDTISITDEPTSGSSSVDYIATEKGVFNPSETGIHKLDINGQTVEIDVIDIPDSVINRWLTDEGSGSTLADDRGGVDGSINGATWISGDYIGGYALDFDGTDDYVGLSGLSTETGARTWLTTLDLSSDITSRETPIALGSGGVGGQSAFRIGVSGTNEAEFFVYDDSESPIISPATTLSQGKNRVGGFVDPDAGEVGIVLNGSVVGTTSTAGSFQDSTDGARFGQDADGTDQYPHAIDEPLRANERFSADQFLNDYERQPWS